MRWILITGLEGAREETGPGIGVNYHMQKGVSTVYELQEGGFQPQSSSVLLCGSSKLCIFDSVNSKRCN